MKRPIFLVVAAVLALDLWFVVLMGRREAAAPPEATRAADADTRGGARQRATRPPRPDRVPVGDGLVRGVVRDRFGAPVGRARIEVHSRDIAPDAPLENHGRDHVWRTEGDARGSFSVADLPHGGYVVRAIAGALHALAPARVEADGPAAEVALVLEPTRLVDGRVLDAGGEPISGAWVHAVARASQPGPAPLYRLFPAPTDAQGRFVFPFLAVDTWRFLAVRRGEVAMLSEPLPPADGEVVVRAADAAGLAVRMVEPGGGVATRFAVVAVERHLGLESHRATTDLYGVARFDGLRAGDYVLHLDSTRFRIPAEQAPRRAEVPPPPPPAPTPTSEDAGDPMAALAQVPVIPLEAVGTLRGRVVESGDLRGVAGITVAVAGQPDIQAQTDASGYYRLGPLAPGDYRLEITRPRGYAVVGATRADARVAEPSVATGPEFTLRRGVGLGGRVIDPEGHPVPDANVFVSLRGDARPDWGTRTGADGTFHLSGFWRESGLRVWAERLDQTSLGAGPLEVGEQEVHGVSLTLHLPRTAALGGRVVGTADIGIGGARVWCHPPDPSLGSPLHADTDPSGAFHFDALIPGVYRLAATAPGGHASGPETTLELAPGEQHGAVRLEIAE